MELKQEYSTKPSNETSAVFQMTSCSNLTMEEARALISQIVISNEGRGGRQKPSLYVFTEQGVAMLSSVLRSERAVQVNIAIMRAFVSLRGLLTQDSDLARRILTLEEKYDRQFAQVFEAIRLMIEAPRRAQKRRRSGAWDFIKRPGKCEENAS